MSDLSANLPRESLDASSRAGHTGAASSVPLPRVALLYSDNALMAHVEEALASMSALVVYCAPIDLVDEQALIAAQAKIALINLDDRCNDNLDALTAMLDVAGVSVVFNDADISRGLDGWAKARWARHLAAKLRGSADVDPPRPAMASAVAITSPAIPVADEAPMQPIAEVDVVASASRPLTKNEIESLLADFPSEATLQGEDTTALSAHVDALLANASANAHEPAPWEAAGAEETFAEAMSSTQSGRSNQALTDGVHPEIASPIAVPNAANWQLLDDSTGVISNARTDASPQAPAFVPSAEALSLELEPLQAAATAVAIPPREFEEMRLDEPVARKTRKAKS